MSHILPKMFSVIHLTEIRFLSIINVNQDIYTPDHTLPPLPSVESQKTDQYCHLIHWKEQVSIYFVNGHVRHIYWAHLPSPLPSHSLDVFHFRLLVFLFSALSLCL